MDYNGTKKQESDKLKKERFKRVAEARTKKILQLIENLSKLSNKYVYEYSEEDIEKIFSAIQKESDKAKECFEKGTSHKHFSFSEELK